MMMLLSRSIRRHPGQVRDGPVALPAPSRRGPPVLRQAEAPPAFPGRRPWRDPARAAERWVPEGLPSPSPAARPEAARVRRQSIRSDSLATDLDRLAAWVVWFIGEGRKEYPSWSVPEFALLEKSPRPVTSRP